MRHVRLVLLSPACRINFCAAALILVWLAGVTSSSAQRTNPPPNPPSRGIRVPRLVELTFARVSSITQEYTEKGGTTQDVYSSDLVAHFVWQAPSGNNFAWRWQVAVQPFPREVTLAPPGLVAEQDVASRTFAINFGKFPPLSARSERMSRVPPQPIDFYVRIIAINNGQPVLPSNVVVAHYKPERNPNEKVITEAMKNEANKEAKKKAELEALEKTYSVQIISFKPALFPDPNQWGCVVITKNENPFLKTVYPPGKYCGKTYSGQGKSLTAWDYVTGWAKAYEIVSDFYSSAKSWAAKEFAKALPCEKLGKAGSACEKYATDLAGVAMNVGLAAAGVPPTLPNLNELAKGQAVDAGVNFTCDAIESEGGKCTPQMRTALAKGYSVGLDKLQHDLNKVTKEPGCNNEQLAHDNGREPLPCFSDYPGVEFRPAPGAVYEPPTATVRVTRAGRELCDDPQCEVHASLLVDNTIPKGTTIEHYYPPLSETKQLRGELFAPARMRLPPLAPGRSATLTLTMGGIQPNEGRFSSIDNGKYTQHQGWCYIYSGGRGLLHADVTVGPPYTGGRLYSVEATSKFQLPTDNYCTP